MIKKIINGKRMVKLVLMVVLLFSFANIVSTAPITDIPGTVDVISNSEEWFVCGAAFDQKPFADLPDEYYLSEEDILTSPSANDEPVTNCLELFNQLFPNKITEEGIEEFRDCTQGEDTWCCEPKSISGVADSIDYCLSWCFAGIPNVDFTQYNLDCSILDVCGGGGGGETVSALKSSCGRDLSCFGGDEDSIRPDKPCAEQGPGGIKCNADTFCSNGVSVPATGLTSDQTCCMGEDPICLDLTDADGSCTSLGGELCLEASQCFGETPTDIPGLENCCFGGGCTNFEPPETLDESNSFICYAQQGNSKFAECCYNDKCYNDLRSEGYVFGAGVALHTIKSHDSYYEKVFNDKVIITSQFPDNKLEILIDSEFSDWSNFEYLEFLFATNDFSSFSDLKIIHKDGSFNMGPLNNLISLKKSGDKRWNYIVVDLSGITDIGSKEITAINIGLISADISNLYVAYDNIMLRESEGQDKINTKNWYCSGGLGEWISDLDYSEEPLVDMSALPFERAQHTYACNAQMAFTWTGNYCCGDDTRPENSYAEYFDDILHGCFEGVTILDDETLANATNDDTGFNKYLLFIKDKGFRVCGDDALAHFSNVDLFQYSYDGETKNGALITSNNKADYFSVVGSWYCAPDEGWELLANAKRMRIIAAKLKSMGGSDYTLHCGEKTLLGEFPYVMNLDFSSSDIELDGVCVLQADDDVTIGVAVDKENVDTYINNDLRLIYHELNVDDVEAVYNCSKLLGEAEPDYFFKECDGGDEIKLNYNPDFGALLLSFESKPQGFFENMWAIIVDFFTSLFGGEEPDELWKVATDAELSEFDELFINMKDPREIFGVIEDDTIIVTYTGFTDVSFLEDLVIAWSEENDAGFKTSFDANTLSIKVPKNTNDEYEFSDFNWDYLTSNFRID